MAGVEVANGEGGKTLVLMLRRLVRENNLFRPACGGNGRGGGPFPIAVAGCDRVKDVLEPEDKSSEAPLVRSPERCPNADSDPDANRGVPARENRPWRFVRSSTGFFRRPRADEGREDDCLLVV